MGHFKKDCPQLLGRSNRGSMQPVAPSTSLSTPSQGVTSRVAGRGIGDKNTEGKGAGRAGKG